MGVVDADRKAEAEFLRRQAPSIQVRSARGRATAAFAARLSRSTPRQSHPCRGRSINSILDLSIRRAYAAANGLSLFDVEQDAHVLQYSATVSIINNSFATPNISLYLFSAQEPRCEASRFRSQCSCPPQSSFGRWNVIRISEFNAIRSLSGDTPV